jgi:hypothetical protein
VSYYLYMITREPGVDPMDRVERMEGNELARAIPRVKCRPGAALRTGH